MSSLQQTPQGERIHIAIFGRRNVGKSSLINALTGQTVSIVSEVKGTTTDPVSKAMELLPLGPVVFIDTPGLDDEGDLGNLRVQRTLVHPQEDITESMVRGPSPTFVTVKLHAWGPSFTRTVPKSCTVRSNSARPPTSSVSRIIISFILQIYHKNLTFAY